MGSGMGQAGQIPILDFPLDKVQVLKRAEYDLLNLYIFPPTVNQWIARMEHEKRNNTGRLEAGLKELSMLATSHSPHPDIHYSLVNQENEVGNSTQEILKFIEQIRQNG